ncbi:MAG: NYN domain-containing protein [Asticcacaulis sp.]
MTQNAPQLAVLIDGDNISSSYAERLLREAEKLGDVRLKRVYRDWSRAGDDWMDLIRKEGIRAARRNACTGRKNGSDIAMAVEAMKMLTRGVTAFCLFSSDSDFMPLAVQLRKGGARVYGFGEDKTPQSLRQACDRFIVLPPDLRRLQAAARRRLIKVMRELAAEGEAVPLSASAAR